MARTESTLPAAIRTACMPHPVRIAYLFGSHARGTDDADSDVDVAILVHSGLSAEARYDLRMRLLRDLAEAMGMPPEKVDVVVLQDVPVLLQLNVIRNGVVVLEGSRAERIAYELEIERRYDDERPYLEREASLTVERILSRRR
jgi:predicted nucleotidyltransferase